jgi:hypothetical protein
MGAVECKFTSWKEWQRKLTNALVTFEALSQTGS